MNIVVKNTIRNRLTAIEMLIEPTRRDVDYEHEGSLLRRLEWIQQYSAEALKAHVDSLNTPENEITEDNYKDGTALYGHHKGDAE